MSLTSLADAPLLCRPSTGRAGSLHSKPRCLSPKRKDDESSVDALFGDSAVPPTNFSIEKVCSEMKNTTDKELLKHPKIEKENNIGEPGPQKNGISLPTLATFSQHAAELVKKKQSKQDGSLNSKMKDANDVLAGFLADSTNAISDECPNNSETGKEHRDEARCKTNADSKPVTWPATSTFSSRLISSAPNIFSDLSGNGSSASKLVSEHSNTAKKILSDSKVGEWNAKDVLSLLPDDSVAQGKRNVLSVKGAKPLSSQDIDEESSDFGGYRPSCLSMSPLSNGMQRRPLTTLFSSSIKSNETKQGDEKVEKRTLCTSDSLINQTGSFECKATPDGKETTANVNIHQKNSLLVQKSNANNSSVISSFIPTAIEPAADEKGRLLIQVEKLKNENATLKEEIMKIEEEKLKMEKDFLEKELLYEPERSNRLNLEREEAQKIAEDLTLELLSVKQNLSLTEEKIACMEKVHEHEIEMLKSMHKEELEMKERQLHLQQETFVAERKEASEAFSKLLSKADEWSSRIDHLQKNILPQNETNTEKSTWIGNIESMVSDHQCTLQMLEKRSSQVFIELEKVAVLLDKLRKGMENVQSDKDEHFNKMQDQPHAIHDIMNGDNEQMISRKPATEESSEHTQDDCTPVEQTVLSGLLEKQQLEAERETVLCMKEQLLQADALLRKQLHEHTVHMQEEAEDMARQKKELEHARDIAAEIAVEVETTRRELDMYKAVFNARSPEQEDKSWRSTSSAYKLPSYERSLELIRRHKLQQRPYSTSDVYGSFSVGLNIQDNFKRCQPGASSKNTDEI
ncbi:hypothetical protein KP509_04G002500 [Ceratopteris richardii]|uniref:Uncharacterized protein n=1 Tax=Ceratopteris richardii TaxID=49495 RepID=A0A8T2UTS2_CERRI|nr:hypothetical protein KP509_04G002500 [Ceratopteris richardii]